MTPNLIINPKPQAEFEASHHLDFAGSLKYYAQVNRRKGRQDNYDSSAEGHQNRVANLMARSYFK